jgi:hypothetical protein
MGATPEESQTDAGGEATPAEELGGAVEAAGGEDGGEYDSILDDEILGLLAPDEEEEGNKPFGNQIITEDEAVDMDRK